jgi:hypothetical protein
VVLGGAGLQQDGGGASVVVGGAPLLAPPLHAQLLADLLHLGLQLPLLRLQALLLRLPEASVTPPVEPGVRRYITNNIELHFLHYNKIDNNLLPTYGMLYVLALKNRFFFSSGQCTLCKSLWIKASA